MPEGVLPSAPTGSVPLADTRMLVFEVWAGSVPTVLVGGVNLRPYGKLEYQVGYLWDLTPESGRSAIRWRLEYEITF